MIKYQSLLKCILAVGVGLISGCASMSEFFSADQPRQGQAATIKTLAKMPKYYVVQPGDTLPSISRRYGISERAIILWNNLEAPYRVHVGQRLQFFDPNQVVNNSNMANTDNDNNANDLQEPPVNRQQNALIQSDTPVVEAQKPITENTYKENLKTEYLKEDNSSDMTYSEPVITQTKLEPVSERPEGVDYYRVTSGDTLLSIAKSYDLTLTQIATINHIDPPYDIYIGQKLLVNEALYKEKLAKQLPSQTATKSVVKKEVSSQVVATDAINSLEKSTVVQIQPQTKKVTSVTDVEYAGINWQLPLKGTIKNEDKVWLISGYNNQSILASASGKVIYAGVGVNGYGKMVIIDHGNNYLSAYANLDSLSVQEGQSIQQGQIVGKLGKFKGETQLGFEVRYQGELIPPSKLFNQTV
ncbi:LysM peptidoglycan-binding domain-containing protein [Thiotrichales bacterium 19S11-10]|nr:LysM peptidoglycan-binding domain-containing protein [Thiotrichales bacterium 19S11-10]